MRSYLRPVDELDNPAVRELLNEGPLALVVWEEVKAYAAEHDLRDGVMTFQQLLHEAPRRLVAAGQSLDLIGGCVDAMIFAGLVEILDEEKVRIADWGPKTAAERAATYRRRKRSVTRRDAGLAGRQESLEPQGIAGRVTERDAALAHDVRTFSTSLPDVQDILPPPTPARSTPESENGRLRTESLPEGSTIEVLLETAGMFQESPPARHQKAGQLNAWGVTLEALRRLWDYCKRVSRNPRKLFGWALKDAGKLKLVRTRAESQSETPPARPPAPKAVPNHLDGFGPAPRRERPAPRQSLPAWGMPKSTSRSPFRGER